VSFSAADNSHQTANTFKPFVSVLALFLLGNLAIRLSLINFNTGEYTDGILQVSPPASGRGAGLYPPCFGWIAHFVSLTGLNLELSGRLVSILAGTMTLTPIYLTTRRYFSEDAARLSAVFFTISPLLMRWSLHCMTDALFTCLATWGLHWLIRAWTENSQRSLTLGIIACGIAAGIRYQGVLLAVIVCVATIAVTMQTRRLPWRAVAAAVVWIFPAYWYVRHGQVHAGQFADRTTGTFWLTASAYWNTLESFVLIAPYYFGYPVFAFALVGLVFIKHALARVAPLVIMPAVLGYLLLGIHSAFGSFQYRYMMPLLPWLLVFAGHGAHQLYLRTRTRGWSVVYSTGFIAGLAYLVLFTCAVLIGQRQTFGDQNEAAKYVATAASPGDQIYGNERYGNFTELGCVKLSFWSGRKVSYVIDSDTNNITTLAPGSLVILGDHYGGPELAGSMAAAIRQRYVVDESAGQFSSQIVPLMDDIMVQPMFNQNPMGWVMRYVPQIFHTRILRIIGPRTSGT
jgi:hypothetical protein